MHNFLFRSIIIFKKKILFLSEHSIHSIHFFLPSNYIDFSVIDAYGNIASIANGMDTKTFVEFSEIFAKLVIVYQNEIKPYNIATHFIRITKDVSCFLFAAKVYYVMWFILIWIDLKYEYLFRYLLIKLLKFN